MRPHLINTYLPSKSSTGSIMYLIRFLSYQTTFTSTPESSNLTDCSSASNSSSLATVNLKHNGLNVICVKKNLVHNPNISSFALFTSLPGKISPPPKSWFVQSRSLSDIGGQNWHRNKWPRVDERNKSRLDFVLFFVQQGDGTFSW